MARAAGQATFLRGLVMAALVGVLAGSGAGVLWAMPGALANLRALLGNGPALSPFLSNAQLREPVAAAKTVERACRAKDASALFLGDHQSQRSIFEHLYLGHVVDPITFIDVVGPSIGPFIAATEREYRRRFVEGRYLPCMLLTSVPSWRVQSLERFEGIHGDHALVRLVPGGGGPSRMATAVMLEMIRTEGGWWLVDGVTGVTPRLDSRFTLAVGRAVPVQGPLRPVFAVASAEQLLAVWAGETRSGPLSLTIRAMHPGEPVRIVGYAAGEYPSRWLKVHLGDGVLGYVLASEVRLERVLTDEGEYELTALELLAEWEGSIEAPLDEIRIFERFIARYPRSPYMADALLNIGGRYAAAALFARAPDKRDRYDWTAFARKAREVYERVIRGYPNTTAAVLAARGIRELPSR